MIHRAANADTYRSKSTLHLLTLINSILRRYDFYAYAGGDPVNRWDPSGLDWVWVQNAEELGRALGGNLEKHKHQAFEILGLLTNQLSTHNLPDYDEMVKAYDDSPFADLMGGSFMTSDSKYFLSKYGLDDDPTDIDIADKLESGEILPVTNGKGYWVWDGKWGSALGAQRPEGWNY